MPARTQQRVGAQPVKPTLEPPPVKTTLRTIPHELRELDRWTVWSYGLWEVGADKPQKFPRNPRTGRRKGYQLPDAWTDFECVSGKASKETGLGLFLSAEDDLICLDIDKCFHTETDDGWLPDPWLAGLLSLIGDTYQEVSPWGDGLHVYVRATMPEGWTKQPIYFRDRKIEIYNAGSWVTVTGDEYFAAPEIAKNQRAIDLLLEYADRVPATLTAQIAQPDPDSLPVRKTYEELDEKLRSDANYADEIAHLRAGDWEWNRAKWPSQHEADFALMTHVAWYQPYDDQMDRVMRESGLYRPKWDERRGSGTYGSGTIARAIAHQSRRGNFYAPWVPLLQAPPQKTALKPFTKPYGVYRTMDNVKATAIDWHWRGFKARGMFHLVAGHPEMGKSTITAYIAATESNGGDGGATWPDGTPAPFAKTLFVLGEESPEYALKPRLEAFGANMAHIAILDEIAVGEDDNREIITRSVDFATDMEIIEATMKEFGATNLVADPLTSFTINTNGDKEREVRRLVTPYIKMAERNGWALLGVMHLTKGSAKDGVAATQQILGSTGWGAAARIVLMAARVPNAADRYAFGIVKNNYIAAGDKRTFEWSRVKDGPITWHGRARHQITAILEQATESKPQEAVSFLRWFLAEGPKFKSDVLAASRAATIADGTLEDAAINLKVVKDKEKGVQRPRAIWSLPPA